MAILTAVIASLTAPAEPNPTADTASLSAPWARSALRAWSRFPASVQPRPLVLAGPTILDPLGGFPDGPSKLAYVTGAIDPPGSWPQAPPSDGGYPVRSAVQAFEAFSTDAASGPPATSRLSVVRVGLGSAVFATDRGPRLLPAWEFWLGGVEQPAAVLAVASDRVFEPQVGPNLASLISAFGDPENRRLVVSFVGAPPGTGPCSAEYSVQAASTSTAVAIRLIEQRHGQQLSPEACSAVGYLRQAPLMLSAPLGARVLVDSRNSAPIPVAQTPDRLGKL